MHSSWTQSYLKVVQHCDSMHQLNSVASVSFNETIFAVFRMSLAILVIWLLMVPGMTGQAEAGQSGERLSWWVVPGQLCPVQAEAYYTNRGKYILPFSIGRAAWTSWAWTSRTMPRWGWTTWPSTSRWSKLRVQLVLVLVPRVYILQVLALFSPDKILFFPPYTCQRLPPLPPPWTTLFDQKSARTTPT